MKFVKMNGKIELFTCQQVTNHVQLDEDNIQLLSRAFFNTTQRII